MCVCVCVRACACVCVCVCVRARARARVCVLGRYNRNLVICESQYWHNYYNSVVFRFSIAASRSLLFFVFVLGLFVVSLHTHLWC